MRLATWTPADIMVSTQSSHITAQSKFPGQIQPFSGWSFYIDNPDQTVFHDNFSKFDCLQSPSVGHEMRVLGGREDNPQPEVEQEVISKYEQEPEFRNFIKNLLRCRSLASLDINKDAKAEEEEKTARQEKQNDDIERRPVGRGRAQERRRNHQAQLSQRGRTEEEKSGRGEPGDNGVRNHSLVVRYC